tara:strand:+ start:293 stop:1519 length:1227 start_codon:yes stop_codon:yes gene_type:complete
MNHEHKDKPHVYIKENKIVVQQDDQVISLNLSHAQMLVQELIEADQVLRRMEEKKKSRIDSLRVRLKDCSINMVPSERRSHILRWNDRTLHKAPAHILASCFSIDDDGWAVADPELTRLGCIGLFFAISTHEEQDIISELWDWGAFDEILCSKLWDIPSSQIPKTFQTRLAPFVSQECFVPAGEFMMGFEGMEALPCEYPQRKITQTRDMYMTRFPMTQLQYWSLTDQEPSHFQGALRPVDSVSWFDAIEACNLYSLVMGYAPAYHIDKEGVRWDRSANGYRLPTEAEWESAARADQEFSFSGSDDPHEVAWFSENAQETKRVGSKEPNAAYLYDMTGNVWEWVFDAYDEEAYRNTGTIDPVVETGAYRVCRGGAFTSSGESTRISIRGAYEPEVRNWAVGFRMVRFA